MVFTNVLVPRSEFPQKGSKHYLKTLVKKSASIGANVTVVCGTKIGQYSLIGAGAVVTKDVPDFALVMGNPGRIVGWVDEKGNKLSFYKNGKSKCNNFLMDNNRVVKLS